MSTVTEFSQKRILSDCRGTELNIRNQVPKLLRNTASKGRHCASNWLIAIKYQLKMVISFMEPKSKDKRLRYLNLENCRTGSMDLKNETQSSCCRYCQASAKNLRHWQKDQRSGAQSQPALLACFRPTVRLVWIEFCFVLFSLYFGLNFLKGY